MLNLKIEYFIGSGQTISQNEWKLLLSNDALIFTEMIKRTETKSFVILGITFITMSFEPTTVLHYVITLIFFVAVLFSLINPREILKKEHNLKSKIRTLSRPFFIASLLTIIVWLIGSKIVVLISSVAP